MAKLFNVKAKYVNMPNYPNLVRAAMFVFIHTAGGHLETKMRAKFGVYQPGWPKLRPATLAAKGAGKRIKGRGKARGGIHPDRPLIDTGKMLASVTHIEQGLKSHILIDYPMAEHEQEAGIGPFTGLSSWGKPLPARPLMWPTWNEESGNLANMLENFVAARL